MKIAKLDVLAADAGITTYHFLKITTDDGLVGWSEFGDATPAVGGLAAMIQRLGERVIGKDPCNVQRLTTDLWSNTRYAAGGFLSHAMAAIENACLDIKGKAYGVPVYDLFGGPLRDRVPLYWSHCGMYRAMKADFFEKQGDAPVRSLDDIVALGAEAKAKGYKALKTNLIRFDGPTGGPVMHRGGSAPLGAGPELNADRRLIAAAGDLLDAFRQGAGDEVEISLDLNFNFRADGFIRMARALERHDLAWLEIDNADPSTLAAIRRSSRTPVGSLETVYNRRDLVPYLEQRAVDLAIFDVTWNGFGECLAMASMAHGYEVSMAPHNYGGPLAAMMSAHLAVLSPNLRVMEYDVDGATWRNDFVTCPMTIEDGALVMPTAPGWGCDVDEAKLRDYPVKGA